MSKMFAVLFTMNEQGDMAIVSPLFDNPARAVGWAKERSRHTLNSYTIAEILPRETVKWEGGEV